jgi:mRNA-degrading endonuclease RelE of RelBE toxin-antitoxin system
MQGKNKPKLSTTSSTNYKVLTTDGFIKEAKKLKKKYPNIGEDFRKLSKELKHDPITGHAALGQDCYKIRMAISDKNQGQSGGARVIVEVKIIDKVVYILSVYDKSIKEDLLDGELEKMLKNKSTTR